MKRMRSAAALARLAAANPFPADAISDVTPPAPPLPGRDERRDAHAAPRRSRRTLVVATVLAVAAFAPAVALSERTRDLFGFTNRGAPVPTSALATDQVSKLERVGVSDGVRKLGERRGTAFYVGRSKNGALCFATGPTTRPAPAFGVLACQGGEGDVFPSQRVPIADLSPLRGHGGSSDVYVWKLVGFAADGVAAVAFRDVTGALHATEVAGNIYASGELPAVAATEIVALDADGHVLYSKPLESSTPG